jgi:hypothetical protein
MSAPTQTIYDVAHNQNAILQLFTDINNPKISNEKKMTLLTEIKFKQEELNILITTTADGLISNKKIVMSFDLSYLKPERLCFDMRWYIQSFLPYRVRQGKNYYHYKSPTMIDEWFKEALNTFRDWTTNTKRLFLINNIYSGAKAQNLNNCEEMKYWILKKSSDDLNGMIQYYRSFNVKGDKYYNNKYFIVRNKYGEMRARMPPIRMETLAGRIMYVDKRIRNTQNTMKEKKKFKAMIDAIKTEWNETKYMGLTIS